MAWRRINKFHSSLQSDYFILDNFMHAGVDTVLYEFSKCSKQVNISLSRQNSIFRFVSILNWFVDFVEPVQSFCFRAKFEQTSIVTIVLIRVICLKSHIIFLSRDFMNIFWLNYLLELFRLVSFVSKTAVCKENYFSLGIKNHSWFLPNKGSH